MKHYYLLLISLCLILMTPLFGQEQLKHEKKWYIDKNGRFYTNKHLPVYFRISHSPDEGAASHLLKSESMPQYSNPMYFDIDGYNTLRSPSAVDTVTKQTILPKIDVRFEVYADGTAPNSASIFVGAPRYIKSDGTVFYGKSLKVELKSNDAVSGVESIYYSINGAAYKPYSSQIPLETEGEYTIKYYAVDNVGNAENPKSKKFTVDVSPPITKQTVNGEIINDIISPKASVILTTEDNLAGVKKIMYYFNNEKPRRYTHPISLAGLSDGDQKLSFYAIDNVNNYEDKDAEKTDKEGEMVEYKFYLDRSVPFASASVVGDQHSGKHLFISERSKIKLESTDNKGGVNKINYGVNQVAKTNVYSEPFDIPKRKGLYYVNYIATDNVKNVTPNNVFAVYMDNVAPVSKISIGMPKFYDRDTLFITKNSNINIYANDYESRVKIIEYGVDSDGLKKFAPFTIENEGFHKIQYRTTDNVNNQEEMKYQEVVVDNNSPEIFVVFSVNPIGTESKDGKSYPVYPTYTRVFLAASDKFSGTEHLMYSINGGYMTNYLTQANMSGHSMFTKEGFYTVKIIAKDKLGNKTEKVVEFFTKRTIDEDKK